MARTIAAAGGGLLACAVVLLLAGQSAAQTTFFFPFTSTFPALFPVGYVPPIVRIYSKQSNGRSALNLAARNDGTVVLTTAKSDDRTQLWWKIPPSTSLVDGEGEKYWLVNVATNQAIASPTTTEPVRLAQFNPSDATQLWVPTTPLNGNFYQIKPYTNDNMALNAFGGAFDGAVIGIWPDQPVSINTLWVTSNVFPFPFF